MNEQENLYYLFLFNQTESNSKESLRQALEQNGLMYHFIYPLGEGFINPTEGFRPNPIEGKYVAAISQGELPLDNHQLVIDPQFKDLLPELKVQLVSEHGELLETVNVQFINKEEEEKKLVETVKQLFPKKEELLQKLVPTLDVDTKAMCERDIMLLKAQYESSLSTISMLIGDKLQKMLGDDNFESSIDTIAREIVEEAGDPIKNYSLALKEQETMVSEYQEDIARISRSYTERMEEWIKEEVKKLEAQYRAENPDDSEVRIAQFIADQADTLEEVSHKLHLAKVQMEQHILRYLARHNDRAELASVIKFLNTKEQYQQSLSDVIQAWRVENQPVVAPDPTFTAPIMPEPAPMMVEPTPAPVEVPVMPEPTPQEIATEVERFAEIPEEESTEETSEETSSEPEPQDYYFDPDTADVVEDGLTSLGLDDIEALAAEADNLANQQAQEQEEMRRLQEEQLRLQQEELARLQQMQSELAAAQAAVQQEREALAQQAAAQAAVVEPEPQPQVQSPVDDEDEEDLAEDAYDLDDMDEDGIEAYEDDEEDSEEMGDYDFPEEDEDSDEEDEEVAPQKKKKLSGKQIGLISGIALVVIVILGALGFFFFGGSSSSTPSTNTPTTTQQATPATTTNTGSTSAAPLASVGDTLVISIGGKEKNVKVVEVRSDGSVIVEDSDNTKLEIPYEKLKAALEK